LKVPTPDTHLQTAASRGTIRNVPQRKRLSGNFNPEIKSIPEDEKSGGLHNPPERSAPAVPADAGSDKSKSEQDSTIQKEEPTFEKTKSNRQESLSDIVLPERHRKKDDRKSVLNLLARPHTPLPEAPKEKPYLFQWEYGKMDETDWLLYDDIAQGKIEEAWRKDLKEVTLDHGFFQADTYKVVLKGLGKMVQENNKTHNTRLVRRFPLTYPYEFTWYFDSKAPEATTPDWKPYDKHAQITIERAFSENKPKVKLETGFFTNNPYMVHLSSRDNKYQKNIKTKKKRPIKRDPPEITLAPKPNIGVRKPVFNRSVTDFPSDQSVEKTPHPHRATHGKKPLKPSIPLLDSHHPENEKRQLNFRISNPAELLRRWVDFLKHDTNSGDPYELDFETFTVNYYPEFYLTKMDGFSEPQPTLNLNAGWYAKEVKPESIQNIQYPEELISKKGDQTYILSHTLVRSVVIRWIVESNSWVILQAEGDVVGNFGLTIMMAEMLEPLFPYKRASKYDVIRIKFDEQYSLRDDQKGLLNELSAIVSDLVKHFDTQLNQLPSTASVEEITDLGNDKKMENY